MLLEISKVTTGYGRMPVVWDLDLTVAEGEIVALLGPNGAGKTTALLTAGGFLRPMSGTITLDGASITAVPPYRLSRHGLAAVTDDRALLPSLTVQENLALVRNRRSDPLALFPELERLMGRRAGLLSGGEQQMLALARALCSRPKAILLDELSQGLAPLVVERCLKALTDAAAEWGLGVLLVEQNVSEALKVADRACVLSHGRVALESDAASLREDTGLIESSYLGEAGAGPGTDPGPGSGTTARGGSAGSG
ncbi:ABC transporter ATP-binding protein [Actinomadura rugatobispora]|uniref:ABC transporter ATP-binding protein n=1 Tax=Actinomadura rugatobispora TaxID=1994 RepID=A0ABW1A6P5_9ACTN|nr:ABC transporter ATP-binding protein [Actinomadura rugatobispora]